MKKVLLSILTVFVINSLFAQAFVQGENDITFTEKGGYLITGTIYVQKNFNENTNFGFSNFVLVNKGYAEITPAITYQAGKVSLYAGIGMETVKPHWRITTGALYVDSLNTVKLFFERGGGAKNYWYHISAERMISKKFSAGVMSRRFYGTGVRVGCNITNNLKVAEGVFYDTEFKVFRNSLFLTFTL